MSRASFLTNSDCRYFSSCFCLSETFKVWSCACNTEVQVYTYMCCICMWLLHSSIYEFTLVLFVCCGLFGITWLFGYFEAVHGQLISVERVVSQQHGRDLPPLPERNWLLYFSPSTTQLPSNTCLQCCSDAIACAWRHYQARQRCPQWWSPPVLCSYLWLLCMFSRGVLWQSSLPGCHALPVKWHFVGVESGALFRGT